MVQRVENVKNDENGLTLEKTLCYNKFVRRAIWPAVFYGFKEEKAVSAHRTASMASLA